MSYPSTHYRRNYLAAAVSLALGTVATPQIAQADQYAFSFGGQTDPDLAIDWFTMLGSDGAPFANSSLPAKKEQGRTPITGTMTFDTDTGSGNWTITPFDFFGNNGLGPTAAATAKTITWQTIGDGFGGAGNLMLGNMLFDWGGNNNIPVSIIWDATGFLGSLPNMTTAGTTWSSTATPGSATPAAEGSFGTQGYMSYGPTPIATTTFNTSLAPGCSFNSCLGVNPSGALPPIVDTVVNQHLTYLSVYNGGATVFGIGGHPMQDGPFTNNSANFDVKDFTVDGFTDDTPPVVTIAPGSISINAGSAFDPLSPPGVTISVVDAIDGTLSVAADCAITDNVTPNINNPGTWTVTYDCQDSGFSTGTGTPAGTPNLNSDDGPAPSLSVTVVAAGAPQITLAPPDPFDHEAATTYDAGVDPGATCVDNNGTGATIPVGANFFLDTTGLDVNAIGLQSVTWTCVGATATTNQPRGVNVQDTVAPVITFTPSCGTGVNRISVEADGTDKTPAAAATDPNFNQDLTGGIVQAGDAVPLNPPFTSTDLSLTYNPNFTVSDGRGNTTVEICEIELGNPNPVATLTGDATVVLNSGVGYTDPGATCQDFADGALPAATPDMVVDSTTPDGTYTITYTCTDSDTNTGTTTRTVIVGAPFSAAFDSGSKFVMLDPDGKFVGGADDIFFSWTGSLYTDPTTQTTPNMFMGSAEPQPFFGFPWVAHDIRAFGPGTYTIPTSRGNTLTLDIAENQIGAHMLFDWNNNNDIDVVLTWDLNGVFVGSLGPANDLGAKGDSFSLNSTDPDGDGKAGVPMADGPFKNFNANFNIKLNPQFALPSVATNAVQGTNDPATVIAPINTNVTVTATVDPNVSGVFSYAGPFTYDWSTSDAALLAVDDDNITSATYTFDPSSLPEGGVTARIKATDSATGLTTTVDVPLRIAPAGATLADTADTDADFIIDINDGIDNAANPTLQQVTAGAVVSPTDVATSSAGTLTIGDFALAIGASTGTYQMGLSDTDIGIPDDAVEGSCVGRCFSFKVSGLTPGAAVDVVWPLSAPIPANATVRKLINNQWRDYNTSNGNAIMSAPLSTGQDCAQLASGAFSAGATEGDQCLKLTIVDGGVNDVDGLANGTVVDPGGVSGAAVNTASIPPSVQSPNTGGGCTLNTTATNSRFTEWWLIGGLLGWLGLSRRNSRKNS